MTTKNSKTLIKIALKKAKKEFIYKSIITFTARAFLMTIPFLFGLAVGHISDGDFRNALFMSILLIVVFVLFRIVAVINIHYWHRLFNKLYEDLTNVGLQNTHDNSLFSLSRIDAGEYLNIMHNDLTVICDFYCGLPARIFRAVEYLVILVFFFFSNVIFGVTGIVASLLAFGLLYLSSKPIQKLNKKRTFALDHRNGILNEILLCIKEIKSFNIFAPIRARAMESSNHFASVWHKQRIVEESYRAGINLFIEIFRLGVFIFGIYLISQGRLEVGLLVVVYNYYGQLIDNFNDFTTINISYRSLKVSENRFNKILEYSNNLNDEGLHITGCQGNITFQNILYGYKHAPTLDDVSFDIKAGDITCIVGEVDSGKSGIIDLLLKLNRQHEGNILIDEINFNDINADKYHSLVASASFESALFNVSIKENLSIIEPDFAKIVEICKSLDIHEDIVKLEASYETIFYANAPNIDQKTKILLGIARVLLKDSKILIFDEVFSLLNKKTAENIMEILRKIKKDHTIIIFTKEDYILEHSDKVIVIDQSKVASLGRHAQLIKKNKLYQEIVAK